MARTSTRSWLCRARARTRGIRCHAVRVKSRAARHVRSLRHCEWFHCCSSAERSAVPLIMTDAMRAILRLNGSRANNHANAQAHKHTSRTTPRGFARGPRVGRLSASGKRAHGTARRAMRVRRQAQNRGHLPNTGRRVARPAAARGRRGRELRHGRVCERVRACIVAQDVAQRAGASRVRFCRRQPRTHTRASHAFAVVAQSRRAWRLSHCQAGTGRAVLYIHGTCHVVCCTEPEPCPRQLAQPPAIILFARARTLIPASHFARAMEACHDGPAAARVLSVRHRADALRIV